MSEPMNDVDEATKIAQEFKIWKESALQLYEMMIEHTVAWPTLTCQWLPAFVKSDEYFTQELLIGTNTNDEEPNQVQILQMDLPLADQNGESDPARKSRWKTLKKMGHDGEVNRARYQPSNPSRIATFTRQGDVLLFDRQKDHSETDCDPLLRLKGHTKEGYGLEWSPHAATADHLLSAGFDNIICHWDIGQEGRVDPIAKYIAHTDCVEDISWNATDPSIFASVADDMKLMIWDTRQPTKPVQSIQAHKAEVNSVAFNGEQDWMLATGSADKTIGLFDIRNLGTKLHSFELHEGEVTQVAWNPHEPAVLASAGLDRRINVWDLRHIGEEQTAEDMEDGPPELLFMHSGHTNRISDFSWNPKETWVIASAGEDNIIQLWEMTKDISANTDLTTELPASDLE
ncbi:WD-40 repeat-containing protein [Zychaea mexicana]|uniref:WD-40 repeat-containing protein n=1 Tax=Zychaea mexicana TaxID=64656 RepID=UPI0022FEA546|nr:WD-40 repeat-containing protein [Zychaea mexicana]KAI9499186.1 WD-40 repeat-containing protein [Zychaea mexicana]